MEREDDELGVCQFPGGDVRDEMNRCPDGYTLQRGGTEVFVSVPTSGTARFANVCRSRPGVDQDASCAMWDNRPLVN